MRGRNQECVAWTPPIYFGSASMDCGPICGRSWEDSCVTISGFVHVLQMGCFPQVYKCGKIQHCPGGLPGQCNGGLVGTPCAECPAGVGNHGVCRFTQMIKKTTQPEVMKP